MWMKKFFLGIFLVFILLSGFVTYQYSQYATSQITQDAQKSLISATKNKVSLLEKSIASNIGLLKFLHSTPPISGIGRALENNGNDPADNTTLAQWKNRLDVIFKALIENNSELLQLRIITVADGREFLRVDRDGGRVIAVPEQRLQDKSDESYFGAAAELEFGEVYVSPINLNREYGKIVFPTQPVYRIAMAIFGPSGDRFGFLIMNIDATELIQRFVAETGFINEFWLVDQAGNFVFSTNSKLDFSAQLNPSWTLQSLYDVTSFGAEGLATIAEKAEGKTQWLADREVVYTGTSRDEHLFVYSLLNQTVIDQRINARHREIITMGGISVSILAIITLVFYRSYRASNKLNNANSTFQAIVDGSVDALICIDETGLVKTWNHAAAQLFGVPQSSVLNKPVSEFVKLHNVDLLKQLTVSKSKGSVLAFKDTFDDKSGYLKHLDISLSPIVHRSSQMESFALRLRDITSEVRSEELLKQSNAQVRERTEELKRHSEELEVAHKQAMEASLAKSNFISTISHEMRTPLNGIMGTLNLIQNDPLTSNQQKYLTMAERSVSTLAVLINDILDLSKIESGKLEVHNQEFSPREEVESIVQSMSVKAIEKGLELIIDTTNIHHSRVIADPNRLKQVINNLLNNAIKFTNEGEIRVVASTSTLEQGSVRLSVDIFDTGIGIAQENQHKLFQPFSQESSETATKFGGTGLGLSICRQLCQLMNGDIGFESIQGKGSHFYFYLDMPESECDSDSLAAELQGQRIGLCLNNDSLRNVVSKMILSWGGQVSEPKASIEQWLNHQVFDAIIFEAESRHYNALMKALKTRTAAQSTLPMQLIELNASTPLPPYQMGGELDVTIISKPVLSEDLLAVLNGNDAEEDVTEEESAQRSTKPFQVDLHGVRVLIVDDNDINQEVAKGFLAPLNASIDCVSNGLDALNLVMEKHIDGQAYHCILLDCQMPVMDGYECARQLRYNSQKYGHSNVPIIAMTANAFSGEKEKCLAHGMSDYITKPVDSERLVEKVSRWTKKYQNQRGAEAIQTQQVTAKSTYKGWKKDQALKRMAGNQALLDKIVTMFQASSVEYMEKLESEISARNIDEVTQWSHKLKGLCGDIGAQDLREMLAEMEKEARKQEECDITQIETTYRQAKQEYSKLMEAIASPA
ncbi:ATP-binding protein [Vibrio navarrensis]|uniref:ATP-binding protein n=1 Tax=Vibrio navarrensis TaxID=29495 RepID=UPI0013023586|nr:ATP-binding protein [Vibrio navarrensis]